MDKSIFQINFFDSFLRSCDSCTNSRNVFGAGLSLKRLASGDYCTKSKNLLGKRRSLGYQVNLACSANPPALYKDQLDFCYKCLLYVYDHSDKMTRFFLSSGKFS